MQVFTELPFSLRTSPATNISAKDEFVRAASPDRSTTALWPDYFARRGQPDALTWQYKGYWHDTWRIWSLYYRFIAKHPIIAARGLRQFYASLIYRVFDEAVGDRSTLLIAVLTPFLMVLTPFLAAFAVCIASLPVLKKRVPALFQPFNRKGWTNYCIMLSLVFALHGYRQRQRRIHPAQLARQSAKTFWNRFFEAELPAGHFPTQLEATTANHQFNGKLPACDLIIKPDCAGGGHRLRLLRWDANSERYVNDYSDKATDEPDAFTVQELRVWLSLQPLDLIVERAERPRAPLPTCSLRVLTLFSGPKPELICAVFIKAPAGSFSTALFDTDIYLIDCAQGSIGESLSANSDNEMTGRRLPEVRDIIDTCLMLHTRLPEHIQVSWDVIPTARGPVYLEGNVFPPGCDYKLTLFKDSANFELLEKKILGKTGLSYSGTELMQ